MEIVEEVNKIRASEAEIVAFEQELRFPLPQDYRQFLKTRNGGRPEPAAFNFRTQTGDSDSLVDWFYSLSDDPIYSIRKNVEFFRGRIPLGMVAIGCDPFGNQLLLNNEGFFFWDHELEVTQPASNIAKVVDTFSEFIQILE